MLTITIIDLLLLPIYVIALSLMIRWYSKKHYENKQLLAYFSRGFRLKLLFGILFAFFSVYLIPGDTEMYYTGGIDFKHIIFSNNNNLQFLFGPAKDFSDFYEQNQYRAANFGYVSNAGNLMAMKLIALFSIFSFDSYLIISLFFATFSFFGLWCMFRVFHKIYPSYNKPLFITFFMIPSVLFWGSGVMKDTLSLGFLGIGFYNAYLFFMEKKYQAKIFVAFSISFYFLYLLKPYIAMAFVPSFIFWYIFKIISLQKNKFVKAMWIIIPSLVMIFYLAFGNLNEIIAENAVETLAENMQETQQNYIRATPDDGALIDYGEIVPTPLGIARIVPQALVATLFRPFLWEARKMTSLIAALEGAFLAFFTLYVFLKRGPFNSFRAVFSDSTIAFSLLFSIVFATAIGLNCFNLGTLVRYKIPCLPFYLVSLLLILKRNN